MRKSVLFLPVLFFALYLFSLYPTVSPYRDSGDMAATALTLGVSHPPGYPLYAMGGKIWTLLLRLGDAAYRLNVLSALCGATALAFIAVSGVEGLAAAGAVLFLGLSPAFWRLSLVSEMYAQNALFAAAILFTLPRAPYLAAFLFGLGLGNHQTLLFLLPGLLWFGRKKLPLGTAFVLLGLTVYLFLPLRSAQDPVLNWGEPHGLREFWRMLTRADYGGRLHPERPMALSMASLRDAAHLSWLAFSSQVGSVSLLVCAAGAWVRRRDPMTWLCLLGFALSGPFFIVLSNMPPTSPDTLPILEPHLVLPTLCLAPLFAFGLSSLPHSWGRVREGALLLLLLVPIAHAAKTVLPLHRQDFSAHDYEKNLLSAMEPDSLILDPDDPTAFTLSYFKNSRGFREDVIPLLYFRTRWGYNQLHRRHPDVVPSTTIQSGHELYFYLLNQNLTQGRPIYADLPHKVFPPYTSFPQGWAYRVTPSPVGEGPREAGASGERSRTGEGLYRRSYALWELSRARPAASSDFFTVHSLDYGASAMNNLGVRALNDGRFDAAEAAFKRALAMQERLDQAWNNWGNVLHRRADYAKAATAYRVAIGIKDNPHYRYNLGRSLSSGGDRAGAEKEWIAALAGADLPDVLNDLALLWLDRGEAQRAATAFEDLLRKHRSYLPAIFNLGLARARLGLKEPAIKAFEVFRDNSPNPQDRKDADLWIQQLKK